MAAVKCFELTLCFLSVLVALRQAQCNSSWLNKKGPSSLKKGQENYSKLKTEF